MAQLLVHLPDELLARLKRVVRPRSRSRFVQSLLEKALPSEDDDPLYRIALEVQQDEELNAEMADWERSAVSDGLEDLPPWPAPDFDRRYTVAELAERLGVREKNLRARLRRQGYSAGRGSRYTFEKSEYDQLAQLLSKRR
jgi:hypothetical protein